MVGCECGCHIGKPASLCVTGAKKRRGFTKRAVPRANVPLTNGRWLEEDARWKRSVASFCGVACICSRLCHICVTKWERHLHREDSEAHAEYTAAKEREKQTSRKEDQQAGPLSKFTFLLCSLFFVLFSSLSLSAGFYCAGILLRWILLRWDSTALG